MTAIELEVHAGHHRRRYCPASVELPIQGRPAASHAHLAMHDEQDRPVACQVTPTPDGDRQIVTWVVDELPAGLRRRYRLFATEDARRPADAGPGVELQEHQGRQIEVLVEGRPLTTYHFGTSVARPYFHPLLGPDGQPVTRSFPMADVPGETRDHPHHRGLWIAHGDVNGTDNWSEGPRHSKQRHAAFSQLVHGPVFATIDQEVDWLDPDGKVVMTDERRLTFYRTTPEQRVIDLTVTFRATEGDVTFGDTKEGGVVAVRVATPLDVRSSQPRSHEWAPMEHAPGQIENAFGGINEPETWGRRAHWCDYSGRVGKQAVGICLMDHPQNLRHPTYWHVRDYGLMTANPFGIHDFRGDPAQRGDWTLTAGASRTFRYRVIVHAGTSSSAGLRELYHDFINPPRISRTDV